MKKHDLHRTRRSESDSIKYNALSSSISLHNQEFKKIRTNQWKEMIEQIKSPADWDVYLKTRPELVEIGIREGIPDCVRSHTWQLTSKGYHLLHSHQGLYNQLLIQSNSLSNQPLRKIENMGIVKDIHKTLESQRFSNQAISTGSLYNVLRAYANYDSEVGYTEGMSFIAALLLVYLDEEEAFWVMAALLKHEGNRGLRGIYTYQIYDLCVFQFESLLKDHLPKLASHFEKEKIKARIYFPWWCMTMFAARFPLNFVKRIWDILFIEGLEFIFRVGLALLKYCEEYLLRLGCESLKNTMTLCLFPEDALDPDMILPLAYSFRIGNNRMEELKVDYERRENLPCLRPMECVRRQPFHKNTGIQGEENSLRCSH
ncbi:hypothetical protein SUGI_0862910 [Cryptomeria japonica]|nr:hypothetical protein SUGI_0862910 [Cryptomeria japonica]